MGDQNTDSLANDIAIIGMSCRFPGARNLDEFWQNLCNGVESISYLSEPELDPGETQAKPLPPNYVRAAAILEDADLFDADFFDMSPREAVLTDPQHRVFLECAWEALENAGYSAEQYKGLIGAYAGSGFNSYFAYQMQVNKEALVSMGYLQGLISSEKDYLTSRVSYKLNLKGPSITVQTACSTGLASVYLACQGLLTYQCDMALAGGVSVKCPQNAGYLYFEDGIQSPDGHTRAFDAGAGGTMFGSGVGIVVLKRLSDAMADGDSIYAVIKGAAMNNDGSSKVGYTAPSPQGVSRAVAMAIAAAGVDASTISYVEAHGTGTALGDPIEIAALNRAFRSVRGRAACAIGSVKTNFGHLTAAAGAAGLIKTVLALKNRQIPPSLHFSEPNPEIDWDQGPFYVNTTLSEWKRAKSPRRAGINSTGIGGTNVHVILEEAPEPSPAGASIWPHQLLVLSAKTESALESLTARLANHFERRPEENLADAAFTLQCGRKRFANRRVLLCRDVDEAAAMLRRPNRADVFTNLRAEQDRPVVFMFPGQGSQRVKMGEFFYNHFPAFRDEIDRCSTLVKANIGLDIRDLLYPAPEGAAGAADRLVQTAFAQPALFAIEYAFAKLFISLGVSPAAMIGHSIGEYVAACLAGVFSLEDGLALVCARGGLMQSVSPGAMLAVSLPAAELHRIPLNGGLSLAASNSPTQSVVSGNAREIDRLEQWLDQAGIKHRRLNTSHAFHSVMMDEILGAFGKEAASVKLNSPQMPYISNLTGSWITSAEATDPAYWVRHLRSPVRFFEGASLLFKEKRPVFVELGPGDALAALVRGILKDYSSSEVVAAMGRARNDHEASEHFLKALGSLWLHGAQVSWGGLHPGDHRRRLPLPAYPFERERYWIQSAPVETENGGRIDAQRGSQSRGLVYTPCWKRSPLIDPAPHDDDACRWIIFIDSCGAGARMAQLLEARGQQVIKVLPGSGFTKVDSDTYQIDPLAPSDYDLLFRDLRPGDSLKIVHLWGLAPRSDGEEDLAGRFEEYRPIGLSSLLHLVLAYSSHQVIAPAVLTVVTSGAKDVSGEEGLEVEQTAIPGLCRAIREAYANIDCRSIDVLLPGPLSPENEQVIERIIDETTSLRGESDTAYRGRHRWVGGLDQVTADEGEATLKSGGTYLIANGLSATGLRLARELVETRDAKVVLTHPGPVAGLEGLSGLPAIEDIRDSVLILEADTTNISQMSNAALQAHGQYGSLHGIFYLADQLERPARSSDHVKFQDALSTAARGALVLDALAEARGLDFLVFSSRYHSASRGIDKTIAGAVSSLFGALAAASDPRKKTHKIAVCWRGWEEEDRALSSEGESREALESRLRARLPEKPADLLGRLISGAFCQVIISDREIRSDAQLLEDMLIAPTLSPEQDSFALPEAGYAIPQLAADHEIAEGGLEGEIVEVWQRLLGIEHIDAHDNFFDLGGNSLIGIQAVSLVRQRFQIEISLEDLFDSPSPSEFAAIISQRLAQFEEPDKVGSPLGDLGDLTR